MAGTVVYTIERAGKSFATNKLYLKLTAAWTSDASGDVNGTATSFKISGIPIHLITDPDGTDVPTALYDATLLDDDSVDILQANGDDRSATLIEQVSYLGVAFNTNLTLTISNAGNAKKGVLTLYFI